MNIMALTYFAFTKKAQFSCSSFRPPLCTLKKFRGNDSGVSSRERTHFHFGIVRKHITPNAEMYFLSDSKKFRKIPNLQCVALDWGLWKVHIFMRFVFAHFGPLGVFVQGYVRAMTAMIEYIFPFSRPFCDGGCFSTCKPSYLSVCNLYQSWFHPND